MEALLEPPPAPPLIVGFYLFSSIQILAEYERGVIFRLGKLLPQAKGPGIILVFRPIDRIVKVSLRTVVHDVPPQDIITRDNVSVKVNAVVYFRVIDPRARSSRSRTTCTRRRSSRRRRCAAFSGRRSSTTCWPSASG
jgi:regulator of protease activity HflC (stomatin/prohibitin superfamily)